MQSRIISYHDAQLRMKIQLTAIAKQLGQLNSNKNEYVQELQNEIGSIRAQASSALEEI